jgi:peptide/nickel transport system substrate-binding protein
MQRLQSLVAAAALLSAIAPAQATRPEQPLPASGGWDAALIHRSSEGVWYALLDKAIDAFGPPEAIFADDAGRLTLLSVYSGKWTERSVIPDGQWLAPSRPADVDPRVPGREIYAAGRGGNVHRVVVTEFRTNQYRLDSVEIAHVADEEFHCILAADLLPEARGDELLVFGLSGAAYRIEASLRDGDPHGAIFTLSRVAQLPGRVRDAVVLPGPTGSPARIVGVSRSGHLLGMRLGPRGLEHEVLAHEPMGLGRIARRPPRDGAAEVLYVTRDDGLVLRFEERGRGLHRDAIFAGPQGLRGVAAGRFFEDPAREAIAVYGYGRSVQLVSRDGGGAWQAETIFAGEDQGHWLTVGELDGRNGTDELLATGFGGQVVLLSRPPGYALPGAATLEAPRAGDAGGPRPLRIAVKGSEDAVTGLSPLNYQGGFETKTMVYETLVRRGPEGRFVPGLAESWSVEDGGRAFRFVLSAGATHFRRWVGLPEHAWLRSNGRITAVRALDARTLRIELDQPCALLPDLCAINPTAIRGPGALDREGRFVRPVGSGPFAFVGVREDGRVLRYRRHAEGPERLVDLVRLEKSPDDDPLDALLRGEVDAVLGSWLVTVDTARVAALRTDPRFRVVEAPGSSMTYLDFRYADGPTRDVALRRRIAAAIDRAELIEVCEAGLADPSSGWAAPSLAAVWPQGRPAELRGGPLVLPRPLRVAAGRRGGMQLAGAVAAQLVRAGIPAEAVAAEAAGWDLRVAVTHGVPYDPYTTAVSRFVPPTNPKNAESPRHTACAPELSALVERATRTAGDAARFAVYAEIQAALDEDLPVVPLYAPRRIAVLRAGLPAPQLEHDMYRLDARFLTDGGAGGER